MATAYHMVHYRRFEPVGGPKHESLETLCRKALDQVDGTGVALWQRAQDRLFDTGDANARQVLLNKVVDLSSAVFGEMCLLDTQGLQALLELQASKVQLSNLTLAEVYRLDERQAPKGSQFVRGLVYWLAVGQHLFFVKTHSMTPELLRSYIDWLLTKRTTVFGAGNFVLQAEFDKSQVSGDIGEIRSLRLSGNSAPQIRVSAADDSDGEKKVSTMRRVADRTFNFEQARPVAEAMFGKKKTDALVESLGPDEYLAVDASVKVRGRRTAESRKKLREIANDLADTTEGKIRVEGKDGKISDDDAILRTRMPFAVSHEGGNLLEFDNAADQLQEVYSRFVQDGKVKA